MEIAFDVADEGTPETVDREGTGHVERLTGRHVSLDLGVADVGEMHGRGRHRADGRSSLRGSTVRPVDQPVPGAQQPAAPAHLLPSADRVRRVPGLAEGDTVQVEDGVAAK